MELNITRFFNEACPRDYSASVAEIGNNAGAQTWQAACDDVNDWNFLDTDEKRDAFRDHVRGFGAWTDEEIAAWNNDELNALLIQMISGDMREVPGMDSAENWDWKEYQRMAEAGTISGRLFGGPLSTDGQVYYYIGN